MAGLWRWFGGIGRLLAIFSPRRRVGRWTLLGFAGLFVLAGTIVVAGTLYLRTGLPTVQQTLRVDTLAAPVQVMRDEHSIPHIFAARADDAYFALGWVHASDRLFQMEMMRRLGAGRLSEVIGEVTVPVDRMMRTLGLYRQAEASLDHLSPEVIAGMEAYAAGVNAWMDRREGAWPPEFYLLRHRPEPWVPADSLVWGRLMALQLSGDWRRELDRRRIAGAAGWRLMNLLLPTDRGGPVTFAETVEAAAAPSTADPRERAEAPLLVGSDAWFARLRTDLLPSLGPDTASNVWVVAGEHTDSGRPVLANDPHLGLDAPILWYLARISTPEMSVTGATVPGVPLVILGHNGRIAWGFTTTGSDTQDLYLERLDPQDDSRYLTEDGSEPFIEREEEIAVKGGDPVTITVRETRHGPVIDAILDTVDRDATEDGHVLALAWPGLAADDTTAEALWRLNRAEDWDGFLDAMEYWVAPQQNVAYADTGGRIGMIVPGRIPIRSRGDGRLPVPGWTGTHRWTGFIPFDELPRSVDPERGWIANANNTVVGAAYPYLIGNGYEPAYRAIRLESLLIRSLGAHGPGSSLSIQMDILSEAARDLLPLLLAAARPDTTRAAEVTTMLRSWDYTMRRTDPEPLIFLAWAVAAQEALLADELGDAADAFSRLSPEAIGHVLTEERALCDNVTTADVTESCSETLLAALRVAMDDLSDDLGDRPSRWRWDDRHRAPLDHPVFSRIPLVNWITDISVPTDGGPFTLQRGDGPHTGPNQFSHTHGAGFRAIYDLADLSRSQFIIATGQSGSPLSGYYDTFVDRWRQGEMITLSGSPAALSERGRGTLTFRPRN